MLLLLGCARTQSGSKEARTSISTLKMTWSYSMTHLGSKPVPWPAVLTYLVSSRRRIPNTVHGFCPGRAQCRAHGGRGAEALHPRIRRPELINPRGGLPGITINRCQWSRDYSYDLVKTTNFLEKYICWEGMPWGGVAIWWEFHFGKRREVVGQGNWPETSVREYDWLGLDYESAKHCKAPGP